MKVLLAGIFCLLLGVICYFSEKGNFLGYKSPQLNSHPSIWKWTNHVFGLCLIAGSIVFILISLILYPIQNEYLMYGIGIGYIILSTIITEVYTLVKKNRTKVSL